MTETWLLADSRGIASLTSFAIYTGMILGVAWLSHSYLSGRQFASEYYLGSRGFGPIAFTLTFGATSASAGSFAGFPSLIYTHGWVLGLWIAGYAMVPLTAMGLLGRRLNRMSRSCGAITLPDVLRERYGSKVSLVATMLIVFLLSFYLIPQFKIASLILDQLLADVPAFVTLTTSVNRVPGLETADGAYLVCLLIFAVLVVFYTTVGGFRAVVWTDVVQGVVMVAGVLVLLALTLSQVGGLGNATRKLAEMMPPKLGTVLFVRASGEGSVEIPRMTWFAIETPGEPLRLLRTNSNASLAADTPEFVVKVVEIMTPEEIESICSQWPDGRPPALPTGIRIGSQSLREYAYGAGKRGVYVNVPGPVPPADSSNVKLAEQQLAMAAFGFLPLGLALSFFAHWPFSTAGQPGNMVRLMAFNTTRTMRRSITLLAIYFALIYFPLVIIFCCARIVVPGLEQEPDRIMPAMTFAVSEAANVPWLAGILVAAPFAAAMSTVDSFMLMISSSFVRDIYQHHFNPAASERTIKRLSYCCMVVVGIVVTIAAINPPKFLQYFIVFAGGGLSTSFLVPMIMTLYWRRSNTPGVLAAMLGGLFVYLSFYLVAFIRVNELKPLPLLWLDQFVWGVIASGVIGIVVTLLTSPPAKEKVDQFFPAMES